MLTVFILFVLLVGIVVYFIWPNDSAYEEMKKRVESEEYQEWLDELHKDKDK